jgi:ribonuclease P protein component
MAHPLITIKKRSSFVYVRNHGKFIRSNSFNLQILEDLELNKVISVGFTATKRLGNAVMRNKCKRIMRELARKIISKYGKINFYYVIIAKSSLLKRSFKELELELEKLIV